MKKYIIESDTPLLDFTLEYPRISIDVEYAATLSKFALLSYLDEEFMFYHERIDR
jgi:hypothetical protein|tara:strand:- start:267 stop:431 length:165 start_codon:yes stop_codon:yes gene_type:complete